MSYTSVASKNVVKDMSRVNVSERVSVKSAKEKSYAVVVKAKDVNVKLTSE